MQFLTVMNNNIAWENAWDSDRGKEMTHAIIQGKNGRRHVVNIPRHLFSEATGEAARRSSRKER
jgi:hypothetical protein